MVNEMTVHTRLFCSNNLISSNEGYDKEFKDFMLSDFSDDEKYKEVMQQWAQQSTCSSVPCHCMCQPTHVVKGD